MNDVADYAEAETQLDYFPDGDDDLSNESEEVGVPEDSDSDNEDEEDPMLEDINELDDN
jgi:hypothetical protein